MTGVDAIIESIVKDAQDKANTIIDEANAEAGRRVSQAKAETAKVIDKAVIDAETEYKRIISRGSSAAKRQAAEIHLKRKQELVDKVIEKAYEQMLSMSDEDYEEFILNKLNCVDVESKSVIKFAERSGKNVGLGLKAKIKLQYPKLEISDETVEGDGGFVLINGLIEENQTFSAIFKEKMDNIKDMANKLMFEGDAQ